MDSCRSAGAVSDRGEAVNQQPVSWRSVPGSVWHLYQPRAEAREDGLALRCGSRSAQLEGVDRADIMGPLKRRLEGQIRPGVAKASSRPPEPS